MPAMFYDATHEEIDTALRLSFDAFQQYRSYSLSDRRNLLYAVADELQNIANEAVATAGAETHLEENRLRNEFDRTLFQLTSYADACADGAWLHARIDTADPHHHPPKSDLRKTMIPLGPVVVFGASNFPFAYSTAGGDTASALAAGCSVIVKAHPAHPRTSELVAGALNRAVAGCGLPTHLFQHVYGASTEVGKALVQHPLAKAVGFTGSFAGGKALYDWAVARPEPIPVYAEMGSVNPVFLLPEKLEAEADAIADALAISVTQSGGQFCTNPGLIVGIASAGLERFTNLLAKKIGAQPPVRMLHKGIAASFRTARSKAIAAGAILVAENNNGGGEDTVPTLATVSAEIFLQTPVLKEEVFGPYSLLVSCRDQKEMLRMANALQGQLTASVFATSNETKANHTLIQTLAERCGRLVFNGVPTGVGVAAAMHHGGPFPATADGRSTSVGADAVGRFARPLCYQNWADELLPDELKDANPLGIWRTVNNTVTKNPLPPR